MRALIALALLLLPALAAPLASASEPMAVTLDGPTAVAPKTAQRYTVTVSGGPATDEANGNYSIEYYVPGDLEGATPPESSKGTQGPNATGVFTFEITTPAKDAVFELVVIAKSLHGRTQANETSVRSLFIEAKSPIVLEATFRNTGTVAAIGVEVGFYVDGKKVGQESVARIEPNGQARVNHTWIPIGITEGSHTARVEADLNGDGVIDASIGEVSITQVFVRRSTTTPAIVPVAIIILIGVLGLFGILALRARLRGGQSR
jgi:hypothetical protein